MSGEVGSISEDSDEKCEDFVRNPFEVKGSSLSNDILYVLTEEFSVEAKRLDIALALSAEASVVDILH